MVQTDGELVYSIVLWIFYLYTTSNLGPEREFLVLLLTP
jgi:hypothetical protein